MASIRKETFIDARPDEVWDAFRDRMMTQGSVAMKTTLESAVSVRSTA